MTNTPHTNPEGLTHDEWLSAARAPAPDTNTPHQNARLRKAWEDGEDPSEWRLMFDTFRADERPLIGRWK